MAHQEKATSGVEWRITLGDGSSKSLVPDAGPISRIWIGLKGLIAGLVLKVWKFLMRARDIGVDDPRKVIHCLKVGMALTVVSLFYFMRPLYKGVGGNAMWAIMTVVVVFENTVGCVDEHFNSNGELKDSDKQPDKKLLGYKCVLSSKATEESMATFARWEPAHGRFNFKHPWQQYLKIGASMRSCAYCVEALNRCIDSENQAPEFTKKHLSNICLKVSSNSSSVIKEVAKTIKTMKRSPSIDFLVEEMRSAVQDLQNELNFLPKLLSPPEVLHPESKGAEETTSTTHLLEVIPVVTFASLMIEISSRIQAIVETVEELAELAEFKGEAQEKAKQNQPNTNRIIASQLNDVQQTMKALERV